MITVGIFSVDDALYESASTKYVKGNRCVLGWKMIYNARVNDVLYRRVSGIDIVPGEYLELGRNHGNPIKLKIGRPNDIQITREDMTLVVTISEDEATIDDSSEE